MECILSPHLIPRHVTISLSSGQTIPVRLWWVVLSAHWPLAFPPYRTFGLREFAYFLPHLCYYALPFWLFAKKTRVFTSGKNRYGTIEPIWAQRVQGREKAMLYCHTERQKKINLCSFWQLVKCKTCRTFVHFTAKCEQRQPLIFIKLR